MIAKQHRFHGYSSLNFVYRHGSSVRERQLALRYVRNDRRSTYRAAVIVSRKIHKAATDRNRIRRRLYEAIRLQGAAITGPYDLVFTVYDDRLIGLPPAGLERLVISLLQKAGVLARPGTPDQLQRAIVKDTRGAR